MHPHDINRNPTLPHDEIIGRLLVHRTLDASSGCWLWTGALRPNGYGTITVGGRHYIVHRLAAHLYAGYDLNATTKVRHTCDTPPCFNPAHLVEGSARDNMNDAWRRGRKRGPGRKLKREQVMEIRRACATARTEESIAREFGINQAGVNLIRRGRTYTEYSEIQRVELHWGGVVYALDMPEIVALNLVERYGEVARAVGRIAQEVRPTTRITAYCCERVQGHAIWAVDVYFEPGHSGNQVLATLDAFASWLHRQEQAGYTASI